MNNTRKKLLIQIGTREYVIAVYDPDLSRWVATSPLSDAYIEFAAARGYTDLEEAGTSMIRVADA